MHKETTVVGIAGLIRMAAEKVSDSFKLVRASGTIGGIAYKRCTLVSIAFYSETKLIQSSYKHSLNTRNSARSTTGTGPTAFVERIRVAKQAWRSHDLQPLRKSPIAGRREAMTKSMV